MAKRQLIDLTPTVEAISELLNQPDSWICSLYEILLGIEWTEISPDTIVPKLELRRFTKSISDTEIRLAVMKFLHEYAIYYFYDSAYSYVKDEYARNNWTSGEGDYSHDADVYISQFQSELATQISQIEKTGEFSGNKFSALEKKVLELESQLKTLKEKNKKLSDELFFIKHPENFGKHIPIELNDPIFKDAMSYLISQNLATSHLEQVSYGLALNSYYWYGSKSLFGYFVDRISHELELRDSGGRLNWKPFKHAFINFDELISEARNAISKYTQNERARKPEQADIVENAIKYAYQMKEKEEARNKKNRESRELKLGHPILNG